MVKTKRVIHSKVCEKCGRTLFAFEKEDGTLTAWKTLEGKGRILEGEHFPKHCTGEEQRR